MDRATLKSFYYGHLQASPTKGPWPETTAERHIEVGHMRMFEHVAHHRGEGFFRTTDLVNEVAAASAYNLPTQTYRVESLERLAGGPSTSLLPYFLQHIDYKSELLGHLRPNNLSLVIGNFAEQYYQNGQKTFTLVNASTGTVTNAFRVTYIYRPAPMTLDTHVPFQKTAGTGGAGLDNIEDYHDLIAWYALEIALQQEESAIHRAAVKYRREREAELDHFLHDTNTQEPRTVNFTDNVAY